MAYYTQSTLLCFSIYSVYSSGGRWRCVRNEVRETLIDPKVVQMLLPRF